MRSMVILGVLLFIGAFLGALAGVVYVGSSQGRPSRPVEGFTINDDYPSQPH